MAVGTGTLTVITGPSGVGKGTLVQRLLQRHPSIWLSVSATTRSPREGERDGEALVSEFRYGSWSRSFRFPKGIQRDELKASYRDGLLRITTPKAESNAAVSITVEA